MAEPIVAASVVAEALATTADASAEMPNKDNRNIVDEEGTQAMDSDAIQAMRERGEGGDVIIGALVQNSKSWDDKTDYSKEKYIKARRLKSESEREAAPSPYCFLNRFRRYL